MSLTSNVEVMESSLKSKLREMAALGIRYYNLSRAGPPIVEPGLDDSLGILARINQNAFTIADSELQPIGIGIYHQVRPKRI